MGFQFFFSHTFCTLSSPFSFFLVIPYTLITPEPPFPYHHPLPSHLTPPTLPSHSPSPLLIPHLIPSPHYYPFSHVISYHLPPLPHQVDDLTAALQGRDAALAALARLEALCADSGIGKELIIEVREFEIFLNVFVMF